MYSEKGKMIVEPSDIVNAAAAIALKIRSFTLAPEVVYMYAVPRGGIPAAYAVQYQLSSRYGVKSILTTEPSVADVFIDDMIDSGATAEKYISEYDKPFFALFTKSEMDNLAHRWLVFPWEVGETDFSADDIPTRLLQFVGYEQNPEFNKKFLEKWGTDTAAMLNEIYESQVYDKEPWWQTLPENVKEILRFYTWLRTTRLAFLKIVWGWYKHERDNDDSDTGES